MGFFECVIFTQAKELKWKHRHGQYQEALANTPLTEGSANK
jgi:hypothetical protein